jgi:hypothetical protein
VAHPSEGGFGWVHLWMDGGGGAVVPVVVAVVGLTARGRAVDGRWCGVGTILPTSLSWF